MPRITANIARM